MAMSEYGKEKFYCEAVIFCDICDEEGSVLLPKGSPCVLTVYLNKDLIEVAPENGDPYFTMTKSVKAFGYRRNVLTVH
jgi:hypothetical protein